MHYNISFPNLDYLDHVGKSISIFGFSIAYYGMIIGAAILIDFWLPQRRQKEQDKIRRLSGYGNCRSNRRNCGCKHITWFSPGDLYKDNLLSILISEKVVWQFMAAWSEQWLQFLWWLLLRKNHHFVILDTIALALLNGQMLGRWGNF